MQAPLPVGKGAKEGGGGRSVYIESVSYAPHGADKISVFAEVVSQHFDMCVYGSFVSAEVIAPDIFKQFCSCYGDTASFAEVEKEVVFFRGEGFSFSVYGNRSAGKVDDEVFIGKAVSFVLFVYSAQYGFYPRDDSLGEKGLAT